MNARKLSAASGAGGQGRGSRRPERAARPPAGPPRRRARPGKSRPRRRKEEPHAPGPLGGARPPPPPAAPAAPARLYASVRATRGLGASTPPTRRARAAGSSVREPAAVPPGARLQTGPARTHRGRRWRGRGLPATLSARFFLPMKTNYTPGNYRDKGGHFASHQVSSQNTGYIRPLDDSPDGLDIVQLEWLAYWATLSRQPKVKKPP
ncbi:uncharacterized protein LOC132213931 [Myotis daubentonii]|uniref:uncharacterized protein LOC132213931 n=1 Tax=Myotis daubentonii TaxID=98922 RepID=UPI0028737A3F|nr:uncharacterized protein LOC132213931 [Myotis daubentonii]